MTGTARAWGWYAHLRDGGTTPWCDWAGTGSVAAPRLPGAQQLELLRRVNGLAGSRGPAADVVEDVLAADPPRRSRPDLPLVDGGPAPGFGPPPVDPAQLPAHELLGLLAVVLARRLARETPPQPPVGRVRPWAPRYHLYGDPELARVVRRHLVVRGRPEATHGGRALVLGDDVGRMLADLWTDRALGVGGASWPEWWRRWVRSDRLPAAADLARVAEEARRRPGVRGVEIVLDPAAAVRRVGVRRPPQVPRPLAAVAVELGRLTAAELRPLVEPGRRDLLVSEVLRPRLATLPGSPLAVPRAHRGWVAEQAEQLIARLGRQPDRYPVLGDLAALRPAAPSGRPGAGTIRPRRTLAAGIRLLLDEELP